MQQTKGKILVVDDNKALADLMSAVLREEGYTVITAYNPFEAIQNAREHSPHAASTDIDLDDKMCGIQLARELQRVVPGIAVCVMSGNMHEQRKKEAFESGVYAALSKPVSLDHYVLIIGQGINLSKVAPN